MTDTGDRRNFYGRIRGKTLRASQKDYLAEDLGPLTLRGVTREENPSRSPLDLGFVQGPLWLEVGFGGGEHLVHMASLNAGVTILGAEPFVNGIAMLLGKIRGAGVTNLWLHPGDVRDLFDVLPDGCLSKVFLNYPDPWPKARHNKRRFVSQENLSHFHRVLKPGGLFLFASDIADYVTWTREHVAEHGGFAEEGDATQPYENWIETRYEAKARLEGRGSAYLRFRRHP